MTAINKSIVYVYLGCSVVKLKVGIRQTSLQGSDFDNEAEACRVSSFVIRSDEGLTLERSDWLTLHGENLTLRAVFK